MLEFESRNFSSAEITNLGDLSKAEFYECQFEGLDIAAFKAPGLKFVDCKFLHCNLSNLSVRGFVFRHPKFLDCKLMGIAWVDCSTLTSHEFVDCKLDFACFQGLRLPRFQCVNSSAQEVDFSGADLSGAHFKGTFLAGASFTGSNLSGADFRQARAYSIDPTYTKLKKARFSQPEVLGLLGGLGIEIES